MMQWWHVVQAAMAAAAESKVLAVLLAAPVAARVILVNLGKMHLVLCAHCVDAPPARTTAHLMSLGMSLGPALTMPWESCSGRLPALGVVSWAAT